MLFLSSADFFQINFFRKILLRIQQSVRQFGMDPDHFSCFFVVCWFFQNQLFSKNSFRNATECQTVLNQIRPDKMLGLIWVQTVCKGHQQTTLLGEALRRGVWWFSGRVLDLRSRGPWFETHLRHYIVSLSKTPYPLLSMSEFGFCSIPLNGLQNYTKLCIYIDIDKI